jgi:SAM-dependent methyltransferase
MTEQLRMISYLKPRSVLEIGVGKGLLKKFLEPFPGVSHTSVDIDASLNPDYVGSILNLPFKNKSFDLTICCEVLEHLLFSEVPLALEEIARVTSKHVLISVPDIRRRLGMALCLPKFQWCKWEINLPRPFYSNSHMARGHLWEIGYKGSSGRQVRNKMRDAGLNIKKSWRLEKHKWHNFFICEIGPVKQAEHF